MARQKRSVLSWNSTVRMKGAELGTRALAGNELPTMLERLRDEHGPAVDFEVLSTEVDVFSTISNPVLLLN